MMRTSVIIGLIMVAGFFSVGPPLEAAGLPSDWRLSQQVQVTRPGLLRISLPIETLDAARPGLEDLRLFDPAGRETPYFLERVRPAEKIVRAAKSFQSTLTTTSTVITVETGLAQPLEGLTLETPASSFIKAVDIEGAVEGNNWQWIAAGLPLFRQVNGPSQLDLPIPRRTWPFLRLAVNDRRSSPVPFLNATVHAAAAESPTEPVKVALMDRSETSSHTRLTLRLPAANLQLANLEIEANEPLFSRRVTLALRQVWENQVKETSLAHGTIYRWTSEGRGVTANLSLTVEALWPSREAVLLIENFDSPPLYVWSVRATRRPVYLVFLASQTGAYQLLMGNRQCAAPTYDLAALKADLKGTPLAMLPISSLTKNPNYMPREVLPKFQDTGAPLDASAWKFRKAVRVNQPGVQQMDLDPEVLSQAQPDLQDLRLLQGDWQVPFLLERTSIQRTIIPKASLVGDPQHPTRTRWALQLPYPRLPVTRLVCSARTPLFKRDLSLFEEVVDERGEKYPHLLGQATWVRTSESPDPQLNLAVSDRPSRDTLFLETENGDNPAVELGQFQFEYPMSRIYFKAPSEAETLLYYGNAQIGFPHYDLSLVAGQVLAAEKGTATLGAEERLREKSWREKYGDPGPAGMVFWMVLGLVVVLLLIVITRLLPKHQPPA